MQRTILITGSTDGIGLETAKMLVALGHHVLLHGRNPEKLERARNVLKSLSESACVETYLADFTRMSEVDEFAQTLVRTHDHIDVLVNNAGVYHAPEEFTPDGLDARFAVNTIAPYLLTQRLLLPLAHSGRVVNISSAAQLPVDPTALAGHVPLRPGVAYAQSKLAITMWTRGMAQWLGEDGPAVIALNPGSMLGTKMIREAFGVPGSDVRIGAEIVTRAALDDNFVSASGQYFDNDHRVWTTPHPDVTNPGKVEQVTQAIEAVLAVTTHAGHRHP